MIPIQPDIPVQAPVTALDRIKHMLHYKHGWRVDEAIPVPFGLLHAKWKLRTNKGDWFVKCYNPERYRRHEPGIWLEIEQGLAKQAELHASGGACPALLQSAEAEDDAGGPYMQMTPEGDRFVVMELCGGKLLEPGEATADQMFSLGAEAARMHQVWNETSQSAQTRQDLTPLWRVSRDEMAQTWEMRWAALNESTSANIKSTLRQQKEIIDSQPDAAWMDDARPGWTHLDFWVDNLLFHEGKLSAIVDFDRVRFAYPRLDLGRAVLSCALQDNRINQEPLAAFAEGFRQRGSLPRGALLGAVRHVWAVESFWWLHAGMERIDRVPNRFTHEMQTIMNGWSELDSALGNL